MPASQPPDKQINRRYSTDRIRVSYAHVGLFDVQSRKLWLARNRRNMPAVRISHSRLLVGGTQDTSTGEKDRFLCYWYHTPGTGQGYVHGYPIEWDEGHVMVRVDPSWDFMTRKYIPPTEAARCRRSLDQQYDWGQFIYRAYVDAKPRFALSWHIVGPRPTDSMFYIERHDPGV